MLRTWISAGCVAALALAAPAAAFAQSKAAEPASVRRPYRGIFAPPPAADSGQSLTLNGSLFGAYDDNILAAVSGRPVRNPLLQDGGAYAGAEGGLTYGIEKTGSRLSFGALSAAQVRYIRRSADTSTAPNAVADLHIDWQLSRSTTLLLRETASYASRYNFSLTPLAGEDLGHDIVLLDDPAFDLFDLRAVRAASTVFLKQEVAKGTSVSAGYLFRTVEVLGDPVPGERFHSYRTSAGSFGINHAHHVTPHAELQLAYDLRVSDRRSQTGEPTVMHRIDAGINYSRPLSFSRRTTVHFGSGSAIIPPVRRPDGTTDGGTHYRLTGNAGIVHEMGRTWTAQVQYARGVRARDGFGDLHFIDAVSADVQGLFTRRLSWTSTARWSISAIERSASGRGGFRGQSASAQTTYALNRLFGVYVRYVYYSYHFGEDVRLDPRLPRDLDRQGARVGLAASVPLLR